MFKSRKIEPETINTTIVINIKNGITSELNKEEKQIVYKCLSYTKQKKLIDLDNAIKFQSIKHIIDKKDAYSEVEYCCKICVENPINVVCIPCGHLFCYKCLSLNPKVCHFCRQTITSTMNVYS
jgi:hypothetical protein